LLHQKKLYVKIISQKSSLFTNNNNNYDTSLSKSYKISIQVEFSRVNPENCSIMSVFSLLLANKKCWVNTKRQVSISLALLSNFSMSEDNALMTANTSKDSKIIKNYNLSKTMEKETYLQ
jgi:hypothetical protein